MTTETYTELVCGYGTVYPDEDEDFDAYSITVTLTVQVTVTTTVDGDHVAVETVRTASDLTVSGAAGSNARYMSKALGGMKAALLAGGVDAVSGATCSSYGLSGAYASAVSSAALGTTVTVTEG